MLNTNGFFRKSSRKLLLATNGSDNSTFESSKEEIKGDKGR